MALIPTNHGPMTPDGIVDLLNYASYRSNREIHGASAESLKRLWPQTGDAMEARYQAELAIEKAKS